MSILVDRRKTCPKGQSLQFARRKQREILVQAICLPKKELTLVSIRESLVKNFLSFWQTNRMILSDRIIWKTEKFLLFAIDKRKIFIVMLPLQ